MLCKVAKEVHNKRVKIKMQELSKIMQTELDFNSKQVTFECIDEDRLYEHYEKNKDHINNQVGNFDKIRSRFPECNDETENQIKRKIEKIRIDS